jgi:hypothetical protein
MKNSWHEDTKNAGLPSAQAPGLKMKNAKALYNGIAGFSLLHF